MKGPRKLLNEIHRRSLWQVLGIYLLASWVALQAVDTLTGALQLPAWFPSFALVLLIIGFPIVLATAFVQHGLGREGGGGGPSVAAAETRRSDAGLGSLLTWRNALGGGIVAFAAWGVVAAGWLFLGSPAIPSGGESETSIAVLPFDNLSADDADRHIADGMHDEIIAQLSKIGSLRVISRTSVLEYRESPKNVRTIAEELGVGSILEGSVRSAGDQVRITTQLIDAASDDNLWGETYLRELTVGNLFEVQEEVARNVTRSLAASLSPEEAARLAQRPTDDLEAYNFYLRGNDYFNRNDSEEDYRIAEQMFETAVELDPEFAIAFAALSRVHSAMYWYYFDRSESRAERALEAAERALQLAPDLPQAHRALGTYHYWVRLDYERALDELAIARYELPNESGLLSDVGLIERRQGRWAEAAANLSRRSQLNPRSAPDALQAGITYLYTGDYGEAERHFDRAIALAPDLIRAYVWKARTHMSWSGDTAQVRSLLREAENADPSALDNQAWWHWALYRVLDGPSRETLERLDELEADTALYHLAKAELHGRRSQSVLARAHYDSARIVLERRAATLPEEVRFHSELGLAYAGLGRRDDARREGERAVQLMPVSRDAVIGPDWLANLAQIHVLVGDHEAAVENLESLLAAPNPISPHWLRLDPVYDPLREHPAFQALLAEGR